MADTVAIVELGGKQYLVKPGAKFVTNRLEAKEGDVLKLDDLLGGEALQAKVVAHTLGDKISGLKFKPKARYLKRYGHRQMETTLEIVTEAVKAAPKATAPEPVAKKTATKPAAKKSAPKKVKNG